MESGIPNPTSGHLDRSFFFGVQRSTSVDVIGPGGGLVLCSLHGIPVEYLWVRREKQSLHYSAPRLARYREKAGTDFFGVLELWAG